MRLVEKGYMIYASHLHGSTRVQRDLSLGAEIRRVPAVKRGWRRKWEWSSADLRFFPMSASTTPWILGLPNPRDTIVVLRAAAHAQPAYLA
jgi:hypothetical protein